MRSLPAEQRTIPMSAIAARTKLSVDGVEFLLMKALSLRLIQGVIDQVAGIVQARWLLHACLHAQLRNCQMHLPCMQAIKCSRQSELRCLRGCRCPGCSRAC